MTLIGPYRLLRTLGECEAGSVWSAFDADGSSVTVAVIDAARARDTAWLKGFGEETDALARSGQIAVVDLDLGATTPWVACAWDEEPGAVRLFTAQGLTYEPAVARGRTRPAAEAAVPVPRPPMAPEVGSDLATPVVVPAPPVEVPAMEPTAVEVAAEPDEMAERSPQAPGRGAAATIVGVRPVPIPPAGASVEAGLAGTGTLMGQPPPAGVVAAVPVAATQEEPVVAPEPAASAVPVGVAEPAVAPPVGVAEPVIGRASVVAPEPSTHEMPAVAPEPVVAPPVVVAEPAVGRAAVTPVYGRPVDDLPAPPVLEPIAPARPVEPTPAGQMPTVELPALAARGRGRAIADPTLITGFQRRPVPASPESGPPAGPGGGRGPAGSPGKHRRRRGRTVLLLFFVLMLAGAAAGVALARFRPPLPLPAPPDVVAAPTTVTMRGPGIEPPSPGTWPGGWPAFDATDETTEMDLEGVGFAFSVPAGWTCSQRADTSEPVHYTCGAGSGATRAGGDLIVRECAGDCDDSTEQRTLRQREDAWGLQWTRAGGYVAWAETSSLPGPAGYGLIVVGYWRSEPAGAIDRQVILRMTAPASSPEKISEVRKVANAVHDQIE
jgi:hypothetical protein